MTAATTKCPTCRRVAVRDGNERRSPFWPFCSERCHLIDLGRWLGEEYRVPEEPDASGGGSEALPTRDKDESS